MKEDFIIHIGVPGAFVLHSRVLDAHCGQLLGHKHCLSTGQNLPVSSPSTPQLCPLPSVQHLSPLDAALKAPALPNPSQEQIKPHQEASYLLSALQHPRARAQKETSAQRKKDMVGRDGALRQSGFPTFSPDSQEVHVSVSPSSTSPAPSS